MKILAIDIETSPNLAYVWGLHNQDVGLNQLAAPTEMLCFAAKWLGEPKIHFRSLKKDGRASMVAEAHGLLSDADVVLHYNGTRFDIPHLNREFVTLGCAPPAPYQQIDLCQVAQRKFRFASSKLQHVSTQLGLKGKLSHEGFDLWLKCMAGDKDAWKRMEAYNKQDVVVLEELYEVLKPWIAGHPHRALYDDSGGCPTCGSDDLQRRGFAVTKVSRFQRFQCKGCGSWFRSSKRVSGVAVQGVPT